MNVEIYTQLLETTSCRSDDVDYMNMLIEHIPRSFPDRVLQYDIFNHGTFVQLQDLMESNQIERPQLLWYFINDTNINLFIEYLESLDSSNALACASFCIDTSLEDVNESLLRHIAARDIDTSRRNKKMNCLLFAANYDFNMAQCNRMIIKMILSKQFKRIIEMAEYLSGDQRYLEALIHIVNRYCPDIENSTMQITYDPSCQSEETDMLVSLFHLALRYMNIDIITESYGKLPVKAINLSKLTDDHDSFCNVNVDVLTDDNYCVNSPHFPQIITSACKNIDAIRFIYRQNSSNLYTLDVLKSICMTSGNSELIIDILTKIDLSTIDHKELFKTIMICVGHDYLDSAEYLLDITEGLLDDAMINTIYRACVLDNSEERAKLCRRLCTKLTRRDIYWCVYHLDDILKYDAQLGIRHIQKKSKIMRHMFARSSYDMITYVIDKMGDYHHDYNGYMGAAITNNNLDGVKYIIDSGRLAEWNNMGNELAYCHNTDIIMQIINHASYDKSLDIYREIISIPHVDNTASWIRLTIEITKVLIETYGTSSIDAIYPHVALYGTNELFFYLSEKYGRYFDYARFDIIKDMFNLGKSAKLIHLINISYLYSPDVTYGLIAIYQQEFYLLRHIVDKKSVYLINNIAGIIIVTKNHSMRILDTVTEHKGYYVHSNIPLGKIGVHSFVNSIINK